MCQILLLAAQDNLEKQPDMGYKMLQLVGARVGKSD